MEEWGIAEIGTNRYKGPKVGMSLVYQWNVQKPRLKGRNWTKTVLEGSKRTSQGVAGQVRELEPCLKCRGE